MAGAEVSALDASGRRLAAAARTDGAGRFELEAPDGAATLRVEGENLRPAEAPFAAGDVELVAEYVVPPIHESVVIVDSSLELGVERRNEAVYRDGLFTRDDQVFHTLHAGINAGQHEGGGKSLEIRRYGFNLDHGGVNGGLKVLIDNVQQNQATQGHGQGYLGQLKGLTPELVGDVDILNGPFSAQYGDFSGLGVVHVRLKESLPDVLTLRLQAGNFDTLRTFLAYNPRLDEADACSPTRGRAATAPS